VKGGKIREIPSLYLFFSHVDRRDFTIWGDAEITTTIENESSLLFIEAQSRIKFCLIAILTHVRYETRV